MSTHYIEEAAAPRRHGDDHVARQAVAAGPPAELVAEHAGREAVEVYGPPGEARRGRGARRAPRACARGAPARASRCSASTAPTAIAPEGERRPTNLEDVFVLLTGEEID